MVISIGYYTAAVVRSLSDTNFPFLQFSFFPYMENHLDQFEVCSVAVWPQQWQRGSGVSFQLMSNFFYSEKVLPPFRKKSRELNKERISYRWMGQAIADLMKRCLAASMNCSR